MMQVDPSSSSKSTPINLIPPEHPLQIEAITCMDKDLFKAAQDGDMELFNKHQGDFHCLVDGRRNTALHIYTRTGGRQVVKTDKRFLCFQKKRFEREFSSNFVKQLVNKYPALLLQPNVQGEIPLHIAARHGHSDMVKFLIERAKVGQQEDPEKGLEATCRLKQMLRMTDNDGNTALHKAVESGDLNVLLPVLENFDGDFSFSANTSGMTPLYMAVMAKRSELVDKILEIYKSNNYRSINYYGGPNGRTALHAAARVDDEESARKLIAANEHLTKQIDANGWTPLHCAAVYWSWSVAKVLLEIDASAAYITDKERGMTPLHIAALGGSRYGIEEIISYCPGCCEIADKRGWNFLHFTVLTLRPKELERFLMDDETKIKNLPMKNLVNEKDVKGNTPFRLLKFGRVKIEAHRGREYRQVFKLFRRHKSKEYESDYIDSGTKERQIRELLTDMGNDAEVEGLPIAIDIRWIVEEMEKLKKRKEQKRNIPKHEIEEKARESHLLVAALVATVTFAGAFTVPGGYNEQQETATLIRDSAFKAFIVTNNLAFGSSLLAITFHFILVMFDREFLRTYVTPSLIRRADQLTVLAMAAMVVAFSTGTYVVLQSSSGFAITALLFGLVFFPICVALFLFDFIYSLGLRSVRATFRFIGNYCSCVWTCRFSNS